MDPRGSVNDDHTQSLFIGPTLSYDHGFSKEGQINAAAERVRLRARPVLGNITNKLEDISRCSHIPPQLTITKHNTSALTATSILPARGFTKSVTGHVAAHDLRASTQPNCDVTTESGYCGSDTSFSSTSVLSTRFLGDSLDHGLTVGPDSKRPCNELRELTVHASCVTATTAEVGCSGPLKHGQSKVNPEDESEIDRRPFKSKLACDIVRAAFADRVQLEELLAECRRSDFALSALDRSPIDRMMEATDYIVGIMAYEQIRETKEYFRVDDFLSAGKQPNLTTDMLTTLADWLVEVQDNFGFNHETIHLAWGLLYAYFDRGQPLARREIQLMACAAIMVACKHEERQMPQLSEFLYITDSAYTKEEFIEAERRFLVAIDFAVHRPNPYVFLRRYARVLDAHSGHVQFMSRFLLEAGMHSHVISLKRESRKAAAVLWLARVVLRNPSYVDWTRRTDVYQLRQFMRANRAAQRFYTQCCPRPAHTLLSCPPSRTSTPTVIRCPASGALDLSTHPSSHVAVSGTSSSSLTSTSSSSSLVSRTASLSNRSSLVPLTDNMCGWLHGSCPGNPTTIDRTISEPCVHRKSSSTSYATHLQRSESAAQRPHSSGCKSAPTDECDDDGLDWGIKADLEAMKSEEDQRSPFWPPILQHITGYKEVDLIPLAVRYHSIALRLIAEVARGGRLARERDTSASTAGRAQPHASVEQETDRAEEEEMDDADEADANNQSAPRCVSPGGHYLRRQAVSKYCSDEFLNVADSYPQLAFENFVPHFPAIQCPESCNCFVCVNLIRRPT